MVFGEFEERARQWDELPRVEVTWEQLEARLTEWVELAKAHVGEPVLTYSSNDPPLYWPLSMGRVRSDIKQETDINLKQGVVLAEAPTATTDGRLVQDSQFTMDVSFWEVYNSFQLRKAHIGDREGTPRFQIVFGNEAIAEWFTQNDHQWAVDPFRYVQMANRLGFEPIVTPEIANSTAQRRHHVMAQLVKMAIEQSRLVERIDTVYKSIGSGMRSLHGGLALDMAPEGAGEASLRTYQQRQEQDRNKHTVQRLQQELVDLGVEEADYYRSVSRLLGLDLPSGEQGKD